MLLKSLVYPKENLTTINESTTLQEALDILEGTGFRCVPILDESIKFSEAISTKCIFTGTRQMAATWISQSLIC